MRRMLAGCRALDKVLEIETLAGRVAAHAHLMDDRTAEIDAPLRSGIGSTSRARRYEEIAGGKDPECRVAAMESLERYCAETRAGLEILECGRAQGGWR
jgi:hypothetical protein